MSDNFLARYDYVFENGGTFAIDEDRLLEQMPLKRRTPGIFVAINNIFHHGMSEEKMAKYSRDEIEEKISIWCDELGLLCHIDPIKRVYFFQKRPNAK